MSEAGHAESSEVRVRRAPTAELTTSELRAIRELLWAAFAAPAVATQSGERRPRGEEAAEYDPQRRGDEEATQEPERRPAKEQPEPEPHDDQRPQPPGADERRRIEHTELDQGRDPAEEDQEDPPVEQPAVGAHPASLSTVARDHSDG